MKAEIGSHSSRFDGREIEKHEIPGALSKSGAGGRQRFGDWGRQLLPH